MLSRKHLRRHATEYLFIGIACVTAIFGHSDIQRNMESLSSDRARISETTNQTRQLEEGAEAAKERAAIAVQRYKQGCTMVVSKRSTKNLATLIKGQPVYDRISKNPLPEGTVVCDGNGNTAILKENSQGLPVASDFAFTGNRDLALALIRKIRGARLYYNTPEGGN